MRELNNVNKLRHLQKQVDNIRTELGFSQPREVIFKADLDVIGDEKVIVKADGFGSATTLIVEGNYPIDYYTKFEREFATEDEASIAAEAIVEGEIIIPSIHIIEQA